LEEPEAEGGKVKAVIYTRVSTDEQTKNLSLELQRRECQAYCLRNGLSVERAFEERGESAKTMDRPEFQAMLDYCARNKGKIGAVVVYHTNRFARDARDHLNVTFALGGSGIRLHSVQERLEDTPAGRFIQTMLAGANQLDNEQRADRCKAGMRAAVEKGRWPFPAPLGFRNARNERNEPTLIHDPKHAPLIAEAFRLYATGLHSKQDVLNRISGMGLTTVEGEKLTLYGFSKMLRRPLFAGWIVVEKWGLKVRGNFEPIVSQDLFDRVQLVADDRRPNRPKSHICDRADLPLRGSLRCGTCGHTMTGYFARGRLGGRFGYYGCYNKQCASRVTVPKQRAEDAFMEHLRQWQPTPGVMRLVSHGVTQRWNSRQDIVKSSAAHHAATIKDIEAKLTRLETAFIFERAIDRERYDQHRTGLEQQLTAARIAMSDAQTDDLDLEGALRMASKVLTNAATVYAKMTPTNRRKFLGVLNPSGWEVERSGTIRTPTKAFVYRCLSARNTRAGDKWYARWDLNPQPLAPEANALSS
jgi:site-specific DNA recombinase